MAAGILTIISATLQVDRVFKTKDVKSVAPIMFLVLLRGNWLWRWYGILLKDWPILLTDGFSR